MRPLTVVPGVLFGFLAYRSYTTSSGSAGLYTAAALLTPAIVPYTMLVLQPTNEALKKKLASASSAAVGEAAAELKGEEDNTHALVDRWASLNLVRGLISLSAALVGTWASLGAVEVVAVESFEFISGANRLG
jgi:anthrone oxygenase-like protein